MGSTAEWKKHENKFKAIRRNLEGRQDKKHRLQKLVDLSVNLDSQLNSTGFYNKVKLPNLQNMGGANSVRNRYGRSQDLNRDDKGDTTDQSGSREQI